MYQRNMRLANGQKKPHTHTHSETELNRIHLLEEIVVALRESANK